MCAYLGLYSKRASIFHSVFFMTSEEEDCKEALLAYTFLLKCSEVSVEGGAAFYAVRAEREIAAGGMSLGTLDSVIESYFSEELDCALDFDVADAINKLVDMELVEQDGDVFVCSAAA